MNKIKFLTLLLMFGFANSWSQTIVQAEYFWDTDPGQGNGTALAAADGTFNASLEGFQNAVNVPTTTGLHTFNVRTKDSNNNWGPVNTQVIDVSPVLLGNNAVPRIAQAECFWDADPGQGNGTPLAAADGTFNATLEGLQEAVNVPTTPGLHKFSVRVKDTNNEWGPVNTQVIDISNALLGTNAVPTISGAEYFWDAAEPGEGNGFVFTATDGTFNSTSEAFNKAGIPIVNPVGLHIFNTRAKDNNGLWGPLHKQVINIETVLATEQFDLAALVVYPNPVKDILNVSFDNEISTVAIYNLLGQGVIQKAINTTNGQIDISHLTTGTYIVKVTANNKVKTIKVIKE